MATPEDTIDRPRSPYKPSYTHLFDKQFAGPATPADFGGAWYCIHDFMVDVDLVDEFLQYDRWACGILPRQAVRMIEFSAFSGFKGVNAIPQQLSQLRHDAKIVFTLYRLRIASNEFSIPQKCPQIELIGRSRSSTIHLIKLTAFTLDWRFNLGT